MGIWEQFPFTFQSTLPARGATPLINSDLFDSPFQSTLPARGATPRLLSGCASAAISIHAPCTGSDHVRRVQLRKQFGFQSTLPARGATLIHQNNNTLFGISIHAPCTGSDLIHQNNNTLFGISIHAPCTGSDRGQNSFQHEANYFNPRSLHGERPICISFPICSAVFQSTLPARGATPPPSTSCYYQPVFQSTLPARGATEVAITRGWLMEISIHAPCTGSDRRSRTR